MRAISSLVLFATLFLLIARATQAEDVLPNRAFFLADSQIHNTQGYSILQSTTLADSVTRVAIRPPELNLLAPLVLEHLILEAMHGKQSAEPPIYFVLGDVANVGCLQELEMWRKSFELATAPGSLPLMVHGNHDSFLQGTVNTFRPASLSGGYADAMSVIASSDVPVLKSWWPYLTDAGLSNASDTNWNSACADPGRNDQNTDGGNAKLFTNRPMNKGMWMAWYTQLLVPFGLSDEPSTQTAADGGRGGFELDYGVESGSALQKLDYRAVGYYLKPTRFTPESRSHGDVAIRNWRSYMVQSLDYGSNYRFILIDTSVCTDAGGGLLGLKFASKNAGTNPCLGSRQVTDIEAEIDYAIARGKKIVVIGHAPAKDLINGKRSAKDAVRLFTRLDQGGDWLYISAHSHYAISETEIPGYRGVDINIGSTTDWPMELYEFAFDSSPPKIDVIVPDSRVNIAYLYSPPNVKTKEFEVCRHLPSAIAVSELQLEDSTFSSTWKVPDTSVLPDELRKMCEDERSQGEDSGEIASKLADVLNKHKGLIRERFYTDEAYREYVLAVAEAAAIHEFHDRQLLDFLP